jgi:DNA-binding transcriptional ArsR family regulator
MLTQEEYMAVLKLRHVGFTITEIADELGYHPATVSRWLAAGGPPPDRESDRSELVIDEHWARRVEMLLEANPRLLATSIFAIIETEGFTGSYPTVSRHVRALRGPRFRRAEKASVPIVTAPGDSPVALEVVQESPDHLRIKVGEVELRRNDSSGLLHVDEQQLQADHAGSLVDSGASRR